jgi:hypothetical protein
MRSRYRELGLELVSLEDNRSRQPKQHLIAKEKREDGAGDPFNMLLEEALMQQRNVMMDNFAHIL